MTMVVALERGKMEVTQVKKSKNELEVQISGANETLLGPLLNRTLADPQVDYASYYMRHIVLDEPRFYVRTKKGTPKAAIDRAIAAAPADPEAYLLAGELALARRKLPAATALLLQSASLMQTSGSMQVPVVSSHSCSAVH